MAQVILIKNVNTSEKALNDLVDIVEDDHKFSPLTLAEYTIRKIPGFTKTELQTWLKTNKWIQTTSVWKAKTLEWTLEESEHRKAWKDYDGKWYFLESKPKYPYTFNDVLPAQWTVLEDAGATRLQKEMALSSVKAHTKLRVENQTEVPDVNKSVITEL